MKKAHPFYDSGLELIRISELPPIEANFINQKISSEKLINVNTVSEIFYDCIAFDEYKRLMAVFKLNSYQQYFDSQI